MPEHASPPAPNPQAWLWAEIARRFGDAAAALGVSVTVNAYYILRDGIELWATCHA